MGGSRQTTVVPLAPDVNAPAEVTNQENPYYLIVNVWREDDNWGRGFSLNKSVGHASMSISVPNGSIPEANLPDGIQPADLDLIEGFNFYISLWPEHGASFTKKKGKIVPTTASMSTYDIDCEAMGTTENTLPPESLKISLLQEDHARLLTFAIQMKLKAQTIYKTPPPGVSVYDSHIQGENTLQYCFINTNLSPYSRLRGVVAYNCTGAVQVLLQVAGIPLNSALIQFPTSLTRNVTQNTNAVPFITEAQNVLAQPLPHANQAEPNEDLHSTPTNLSGIQEDAENSDSSDSRSDFSI